MKIYSVILKKVFLAILLGGVLIFICSCATQPENYSHGVPGFFSGLIHSILIPFELILSPFTHYRIYGFPNSGFLYDLGYCIGLGVDFFIGMVLAGMFLN